MFIFESSIRQFVAAPKSQAKPEGLWFVGPQDLPVNAKAFNELSRLVQFGFDITDLEHAKLLASSMLASKQGFIDLVESIPPDEWEQFIEAVKNPGLMSKSPTQPLGEKPYEHAYISGPDADLADPSWDVSEDELLDVGLTQEQIDVPYEPPKIVKSEDPIYPGLEDMEFEEPATGEPIYPLGSKKSSLRHAAVSLADVAAAIEKLQAAAQELTKQAETGDLDALRSLVELVGENGDSGKLAELFALYEELSASQAPAAPASSPDQERAAFMAALSDLGIDIDDQAATLRALSLLTPTTANGKYGLNFAKQILHAQPNEYKALVKASRPKSTDVVESMYTSINTRSKDVKDDDDKSSKKKAPLPDIPDKVDPETLAKAQSGSAAEVLTKELGVSMAPGGGANSRSKQRKSMREQYDGYLKFMPNKQEIKQLQLDEQIPGLLVLSPSGKRESRVLGGSMLYNVKTKQTGMVVGYKTVGKNMMLMMVVPDGKQVWHDWNPHSDDIRASN